MSSRVYRAEDVNAVPIAWRSVGGNSASVTGPGGPDPVATESRLVEVQQESEARVKTAYAQGLAAGEAAAQKNAQQRLDPVLKSLNALLNELAHLRKRVRAEAEEDAVKLATAIARRLIHRELATDPEAILGLVKAAFGKLNAREIHRLRVSPSDAAVIQKHRASLELPQGLEVMPDAALNSGSAIFETTRGELDASIDTQLAEIDRGLTDVLKRRK